MRWAWCCHPDLPQALLAPSVRDALPRSGAAVRAHACARLRWMSWCQRFALGRGVAREQQLLRSGGERRQDAGGRVSARRHGPRVRPRRCASYFASALGSPSAAQGDRAGREQRCWGASLPSGTASSARARASDAVLDAVEKRLQGIGAAGVGAGARDPRCVRAVFNFRPDDLDALAAAGEIMWCGVEALGERDGRIALYLTDHFPRLWTAPNVAPLDERETQHRAALGCARRFVFRGAARAFPAAVTPTPRSMRSVRPGLEGPRDQRHVSRAARVRGAAQQ